MSKNKNISKRNTEDKSILKDVLTESNSILSDLSSHLPPPSPSRGILVDIICSIFEPGVNPGLRIAIHFSFLSLFLVHCWLIYLTEGKEWYIWGLMALNMALYPSLLVFIELTSDNSNLKNKKE